MSRGAQAGAGLYSNNNGMTMSPDGTKIYAVNHNGSAEGFTNDAITQFNLSTPYDLTTMSGRIGSSPSLNSFPSFSDSSPQAAFFSPDGLNLYVSGGSSLRVFRYTLSTAYEVSTATAHSSFASGLTSLTSLSFSQDGTKMFLVGTGSFIRRFTLSTAWDINTATNDSMSLAISGGQIFFRTDGTSFFTFNGRINKYILGTPWDLSSFVLLESSIELSTLTFVFPGGIYISPDGFNFFMSNYTGAPVKRFELAKPFRVR
jgi:sugar lactone lactonase YvrE